jgi:hypothetical protein
MDIQWMDGALVGCWFTLAQGPPSKREIECVCVLDECM